MSDSDRAERPPRRTSKPPRRRLLPLVVLVVLCLAAVSVAVLRSREGQPPRTSPAGTRQQPDVKAEGAILVEAQSGHVLWAKAPDRRLSPASCTKIMTALIVLEHVDDLKSYATVPSIPLPQTVGIGLLPGDSITIEQALRALIVKSANDAALTLATYIAGDEPSFVRLMNARAQQLGLRRTHFENCRGTPRPGHFSTARDLAALGRFAMLDPRFRELADTRSAVITWPPDHAVKVTSHNRLLRYPWADGVKTGATPESGMVLVGSGRPGLVPLLVVTMHEPNRDQEERDAVALFLWGSAQYTRQTLVTGGAVVTTVRLAGGGRVALAAATPLTAVVRTAAAVKVRRAVPRRLAQLPPAGTVIGHAGYWADGVRLGIVDLLAAGRIASTPRPSGSASTAP